MKLLVYELHTELGKEERIGAALGEGRVVDLRSAYALYLQEEESDPQARAIAAVRIPGSMVGFIEGAARSLDAARSALRFAEARLGGEGDPRGLDGERLVRPREAVRLRPPVIPGKIICMGRNYKKHQAESEMPPPTDFPRGFVQVSSALIGSGEPILYPKVTQKLDYEVELAVVIGRRGKHIREEDAYDHVYGYTIFNDVSARDWQFEERKKGNHLLGKNLDTTAPLGPYLVPREFVPDPMKLRLFLRVNGEVRQGSNTDQMVYDIPKMIAHWSKMTLLPGDIISTGTPEGVASGRKPEDPAIYLRPGDLVEAEVEGLGVLVNRVVPEP